jgi:hypothetical protein
MKEIEESKRAAEKAAAEKSKKRLAFAGFPLFFLLQLFVFLQFIFSLFNLFSALLKDLDLWEKKSVSPAAMFRSDQYSQVSSSSLKILCFHFY